MTTVLAPLAFVHTDDGVVELELGDPVPENADAEHVELLTQQGVLGEPEVQTRAVPIKAVLAEVGDDPSKAQAALDLEQAGENRPSLVQKLQVIIDAAAS